MRQLAPRSSFLGTSIPYHVVMNRMFRMIDANANRAREALRVMEDAARFVLGDEALSRELKGLRHDLRQALETLPAGVIEANRDAPGDVGTAIATDSEQYRSGLTDVVIAAGKRLTEAMRVMEESAKTFDAELAARLESLRYRAYDIEHRLQLRLGSSRMQRWRVCVLLTESRCKRPWQEMVQGAIDGGADCIQVREKDMEGGALIQRVREVIEIARPRGLSVIVNDRVDIALAANADGVHLGTNDMPIHDARRLAGRTLLIGASTHNLDEAKHAIESGADYCGVGMMFPSELKRERKPDGPAYLQQFLDQYPNTPHLAIGGITPDNISELIALGARGIAVSSAICGADDPENITRDLRTAIDAHYTLASSP